MTTSDDVDSLIQPVKPLLHIDCFGYGRIYRDNTHFSLCNNASWMELLYSELFKHGMCRKSYDTYSSGYGLWDDAKDQTCRKAILEHSHIKNGMTIIRKSDEYCEFFNFSSANDKVTASYFMNHLKDFDLVADYFLGQARDLLSKAEKDRAILPSCGQAGGQESPFNYEQLNHMDERKLAEILQAYNKRSVTSLDNAIINDLSIKVGLTTREAELIYLLAHGFSYKVISEQLGLKVKTIYFYAENLKKKLKINTKSGLSEFYWNFISTMKSM